MTKEEFVFMCRNVITKSIINQLLNELKQQSQYNCHNKIIVPIVSLTHEIKLFYYEIIISFTFLLSHNRFPQRPK